MGKIYQTKLVCTRCEKIFIVEIEEGVALRVRDYQYCPDCQAVKNQQPGPSEIK